MLEVAVSGNEDVELRSRSGEQLSILDARPSGSLNRDDFVPKDVRAEVFGSDSSSRMRIWN